MKKQWLSTIAAILSAMAALLLCLTWGVGHGTHGPAVAAPPDAAPTALPLADSPPIPPGETAPPGTASTDSTASSGWLIECVDCPKYFINMTDRSLRLDAAGHPRIAYGGDHLYYAWYDGTTWHLETVDDAPGVGSYASLALDGGGYPHISYYDTTNADLKYAYRDASGWHIQTVDSEGDVGVGSSLALDGSGYPHISYHDDTNDDLKYAYRDASGWHMERVGNATGRTSSLALDGNSIPHVSYNDYDGTYLYIKYAYRSPGGWISRWVYGVSPAGSSRTCYTSLALDGDGYPHISYYSCYVFYNLQYIYQDASGWHSNQTVDTGSDVGQYNSLAIDGDGYAHISYFDDSHDNLKYAYQDASGWHIQTMDSEGSVGMYTSLTLDGSGYPHISYFDNRYDSLKYAYQDATGWYTQTVESGGYVGQYNSLALDGSGYPHISYYDTTNGDLKYADQDASGWHTQTVDNVDSVGEYTSLALGGDGYPHISYFHFNYNSLKYAYQDASGWHIQTVDSLLNEGWPTSLALDGDGYPHISYYDNSSFDLKYAYQDASGWHKETVASNMGKYNSLALDGDGYPHISYYCGHLCYAYQDASGWHFLTVDSEGDVGRYNSLALDQNGYAHISYYDYSYGDLKYAYQDASGWRIQTVDSGGRVGSDTSLALDGSGYAHISYYDQTNAELKYAYQDASGWHTQIVDYVGTDANYMGSLGTDTSLALGEDGYPRISYFDIANNDLKYAAYVELPEPIADFTASPTSGFAPLTVVFTNTSTGDYTASLWNFGDGLASTLKNPSHTYEASGTFSVTLTVSGPGGTDTLIRSNFITVHVCDISGTVRFWQDAAGVPGVLLTLEGDSVYTGTTDTMGGYTVSGVSAGDYTLTPSKSDGVNGISAYDASFALRHAAGLITLSSHQATAADVNQSGVISSMDASYILQKAVDLITLPFPGASVVWDFDPRNRSYTDLSGNLSGQDFTAILLGDVSGNWSTVSGQALAQVAGTAVMTLPHLYAEPGERITVTLDIALDQAETWGADIVVSYDSAVVLANSVSAGDVAQDFMTASNLNQPGLVRVAMAGAQPITDDGHLLALVFDVVGELGATSPLQITAAELNESDVTVQRQDGSVSVVDLPDYDFNRDCNVDVVDIMRVASRWRCKCEDTCYDSLYDIDKDCDIDIVDIMLVVVHWGESCW